MALLSLRMFFVWIFLPSGALVGKMNGTAITNRLQNSFKIKDNNVYESSYYWNFRTSSFKQVACLILNNTILILKYPRKCDNNMHMQKWFVEKLCLIPVKNTVNYIVDFYTLFILLLFWWISINSFIHLFSKFIQNKR
jgi:hypothetical protein